MLKSENAIKRYAKRRDPDAFQAIVVSHEQLVFSVCKRILPYSDVEDAVQVVFLKLAQQANHIRGDLAGWLHRCAVTTSLDVLRRNKARGVREAAYLESAEGRGGESAFEELRRRLEDVDAALLELDEESRQLIIRYYLQGESQEQISKTHGVAQSTIKRRLDRAIERLRGKMRKRGNMAVGAALGTLLADSSSQAVPPELTHGLLKIGISGVGGFPAEPSAIGGWKLLKLKSWWIQVSLAVCVGMGVMAVASIAMPHDSVPPFELVREPVRHFFVSSLNLKREDSLVSKMDEVYGEASRLGYITTGQSVLFCPSGFEEEDWTAGEMTSNNNARMDVGVCVVPPPAQNSNANLIRTEAQSFAVCRLDPDASVSDALSELQLQVQQSSYQRTFDDRVQWAGFDRQGRSRYLLFLGVE